MSHVSQNRENNKTSEETRHGVAYGYYQCVSAMETSQRVNPCTGGNPLFWENFLLPECLRDSIV